MNKDVIYIEPEEDITDILSNIKNAKNKIIALVPPKKAGVLRSAVNFKLIAKAANKAGKTVVLISSDESLVRLANNVKMPTAKTLQSKPQLPQDLDVTEFGEDDSELKSDIVEDDVDEDDGAASTEEADEKPKKAAKILAAKEDDDVSAKIKIADKKATVKTEEIELDDEEEDDKKTDKKNTKRNTKVPNFAKHRKQIIAGVVAAVVLIVFVFWALVIAPAAKIIVSVKTSSKQETWQVSFTVKEADVDTENGVFLLEEKTVKLSDSADFEATGEVDKGEKATGNLTITRPSGATVTMGTLEISIPKGTSFTINGKTYISTTDGSIKNESTDISATLGSASGISSKAASTTIQVIAKESGTSYNIEAGQSGWSSSLSTIHTSWISNAAITGGTSEIVKVVSEDDINDAASNLTSASESDARSELSDEFGDEYIMIKSSFTKGDTKTSTTPALNEEVSNGVTPKIISETSYSIFAVKADTINNYITKKVEEGFGDDTQQLYATGAIKNEYSDSVKAYFEKYKATSSSYSAKLVSTYIYGPRITEEMIAERALGEKIGNVRSKLSSINGVTDVNIETSYFWVTSVPSDPNKVQYEITVE